MQIERLAGRLAASLAMAALLLVAAAGIALADGGPHVTGINSGITTLTSDTCAACHRAHTAGGAALIAGVSDSALCFTCHGSASLGATTNVVDGVLAGTSQGLRGGGFSNAIMDTAWTGTATSRPVTSAHSYDETMSVTMWGNGAIGSGAGPTVQLSCASCHNPHGNGSYRILRPIPDGSGAATGVVAINDTSAAYTVASGQNRYFGEWYGTNPGWCAPNDPWCWTPEMAYSLDEWCATCHTRYDEYRQVRQYNPPGQSSGDPIYTYRHMTRWSDENYGQCDFCHVNGDGPAPNPFDISGGPTAHQPVCQACHVAHGSSATMAEFSGAVKWPDGTTTPSGNGRSSLLRLDNRGVCIGCHDPTQ